MAAMVTGPSAAMAWVAAWKRRHDARRGAGVGELGDVGAGGEDPRAAPQHDRTRRVVGQARRRTVAELGQHADRQSVHLGTVEP